MKTLVTILAIAYFAVLILIAILKKKDKKDESTKGYSNNRG